MDENKERDEKLESESDLTETVEVTTGGPEEPASAEANAVEEATGIPNSFIRPDAVEIVETGLLGEVKQEEDVDLEEEPKDDSEQSLVENPEDSDPVIESLLDTSALDASDPCSAANEELAGCQADLDASLQKLAAAELQLRKVRRKANRLELELEESELDLQEIQNAQHSLSEWVRARNVSFAWQLSDALSVERQKAQNARSAAEQWLRNGHSQTIRLLLPVEGSRKLWPSLGGLTFLIVGLVVLFQYLRNIGFAPWTQYIPTPWPMIGFAALVYSGIALGLWLSYERAYAASAIAERWRERENAGIKGLDSGQHALALIDFVRRVLVPIPLLVALGFLIEFVRGLVPVVFLQYFPRAWVIWLILLGAYLITVGSAWISYYKFLSRLRFQIFNVLSEAQRYGNAYRHAATEDARLEAMHSLVPDYLEMLGKPINKPWLVDMSQVKDGDMRPEGASLPASVGLAEATGGDSQQWHLMENKSRNLLYKPGWLTQAFRSILERIADYEGINPRSLTPDTVAADPGDSRRGQRRLVAEMSENESVLSGTGRHQLRTLSEAIQKGVIREIKPLVKPLRTDELAELDISTSRFINENADQVPWDSFLQEALTDAAPFSLLTFSEPGIHAQSFRVRESHALVPKDLSEVQSTRKLKIIESDEGAHNTPLDMVIRIDRSDWLNPKDILLFTEVDLPQETMVESKEAPIVRHPDE